VREILRDCWRSVVVVYKDKIILFSTFLAAFSSCVLNTVRISSCCMFVVLYALRILRNFELKRHVPFGGTSHFETSPGILVA